MNPTQMLGAWFGFVLLLLAIGAALTLFSRPAHAATASWYGDKFAGKPMANGEPFNPDGNTCAAVDRYPIGAVLRLRHRGRVAYCVVKDRGGFAKYGRQLDLSRAVFAKLADLRVGVIKVTVERVS